MSGIQGGGKPPVNKKIRTSNTSVQTAQANQAGFGGANADILDTVFMTNLAAVAATNYAVASQEGLLKYYNAAISHVSDLINKVNAEIPESSKTKDVKLPQELIDEIKALGIPIPGPHKGKYSITQVNNIASSLNNKLNQMNTESQAVAQRASGLTNNINTMSQYLSSLTIAEGQALTYPS